MDFHRNAVNATLSESHQKLQDKYSRFLGVPDFFKKQEVVEAAKAGNNSDLSIMFRQCYSDNLSTLGLTYQDWKSVRNYYKLLYASSSSRGLDFWKKATKYDPVGQLEFDFGV